MMVWLVDLLTTLVNMLKDILPIVAVVFGFQFLVIRKKVPHLRRTVLGFVYVLLGLTLFLKGLDQALFPLGEMMAQQLTSPAFIYAHSESAIPSFFWQDYHWVLVFAFAIGFSTTIAEPSLIAVALKANEVSGGVIGVWGLRLSVAFGVAFGITLGAYRIVVGDPIEYYIIVGYMIVVIQTNFAPKSIVPLAYDSGGVTTSTVTVPLVTALGLGLAGSVPGRSPLIDGFGLIAFASLFPIISVMAYAQLSAWLTKMASNKELS